MANDMLFGEANALMIAEPPVLENEVLPARIRRMKKSGTWESGIICLSAEVQDGTEDRFYPVVMLHADQTTGEICFAVMGNPTNLEELLRELAEEIVQTEVCPQTILVNEEAAFRFYQDFCRRAGIRLLRTTREMAAFEDAKTSLLERIGTSNQLHEGMVDEDGDDTGPDAEEEMDHFLNTLMRMRDEELAIMPEDLVQLIFALAESGAVPPVLLNRLRRLFVP